MEIDRCNISTMFWNRIIGRSSAGVRASQYFSIFLGSLAYDRRLRSNSYDPQRPSVWKCGGRESRSAPPPSFSACSLQRAKFTIIYPDLRLDYKVATLPFEIIDITSGSTLAIALNIKDASAGAVTTHYSQLPGGIVYHPVVLGEDVLPVLGLQQLLIWEE